VYLRYRFLKHLDAYLGVDNALNSKARNYVFGIGLDFIDQDLKYLLGTASGASSFIQ
jgi:phospholipid/cholesterol/gamma-HCH transport system substrate-binding protein